MKTKKCAARSLSVALVRRSGRPHPMKDFRYIKQGETFKAGDQFRDGPHGWQTMGGHMAGVKNDGDNLLVRTRRLSSPNGAAQTRRT